MTGFAAIVNTPGYLPTDDDPPVFDTAAEAWAFLIEQLERNDDDGVRAAWYPADPADPDGPQDRSPTALALEAAQETGRCGTVYGPSPGVDPADDDNYDLGLAYSVVEADQ